MSSYWWAVRHEGERLTGHGVNRHGDAECVVPRQETENGGVDLVHVEWNAVNTAVVRLFIVREVVGIELG